MLQKIVHHPFRTALALSMALGAAACGQLTKKDSNALTDGGVTRNLGCIQGVVINGLTGDAINISKFDASKGEGLRVVIGGTTLTPVAVSDEALKAGDLPGHYTLCDIPLDESYPVVVNVPGFARIESNVTVASTVAARSKEADSDLTKLVPIQTMNVRLYPVGVQTQDMKFVVTNAGQAVSGAQVILVADGANTLDDDKFLIPRNISAKPLTVSTDASGAAIFPAAELTLGALMDYRVIPPTTDLKMTVVSGTLNVGLLAQTGVQHPYLVYVDLKNPLPPLSVVSTNLDANDFITTGEYVAYFNRDIEIVPGTEDKIVATLFNADGAELVSNIPNNLISDQVKVDTTIPNVLHLSPVWLTQADPVTEAGLYIVYSGISLRLKSSPGTADVRQFNDFKVPFFGGVTAAQVATKVMLADDSGDNQSGPALADLSKPLSIKLLNQFGRPMKHPTPVVFSVKTGAGQLRAIGQDPAYGQSAVQTATVNGVASLMWRLGLNSGVQTVTVTVPNSPLIEPIEFKATAAPIVYSLSKIAGDGLNVKLGTDTEMVVQLRDQEGKAIAIANQMVTFQVSSGDGVVRTAGNDPGTLRQVVVPTSADGQARALLNVRTGSVRSSFQVNVAVPGIAGAAFTGAVQATPRSMQITGSASAKKNVEIAAPLVVTLLDQDGRVYPASGQNVVFAVTAGAGTLRAMPAGSVHQASPLSVSTDGNGQAGVYFIPTSDAGAALEITATPEPALKLTPVKFTGVVAP